MTMTLRRTTIKHWGWFVSTVLVALSFPMQVYAHSPVPSLLPYALIGGVLLVAGVSHGTPRPQNGNINLMVRIYVVLLMGNTAWQIALGVISVYEGLSALAIYLLPVIWYWYFSRFASEQEIHCVLSAMVWSGLIVGIYFAYDSYLKLALGQLSDYAQAAMQYSIAMTSEDATTDSRIAAGARSFGLLESHAVSGAWVILGALAALARIPFERRVLRRGVFFLFAVLLLLGLNFTSIVAFFIITFLFEFDGISALRGRLSVKSIEGAFALAVIIVLVGGVVLSIVGDEMALFIRNNLSSQKDLALGSGGADLTMSGIFLNNVRGYFEHIFIFPHTVVFGDGFSSYGMAKGGDIGYTESAAKFGLPFFGGIIFGFFRLMKVGARKMRAMPDKRGSLLRFAMCVTLLVLITEGHYTVWAAKAVLPIIFFSLALYGRLLPTRNVITP